MRCTFLLLLSLTLTGEELLVKEMRRLAAPAGGKVGVAVIHLETGRRAVLNGGEFYPMASTFKIPIAVRLLDRLDAGEVRLDQMVTFEPSDLHPGSGTLTDLFNKPGLALSVRNLLELMLLISDNSATDVVLRLAGGPAAVTARMHELGYDHIRVDRPTIGMIGALRAGREAFNADPSDSAWPEEMAELLARIARRSLHRPETADLLLDILRRCRTGETRLKGLLPRGTEVAHKTGTIAQSVNDSGIITLPDGAGHVVVAAFVKSSPRDTETRERAIAEVARAAHDYFLFRPRADVNFVHLAERIAAAIKPGASERVKLGGDPKLMAPLRRELELRLRTTSRLEEADVFLDLPLGLNAARPEGEATALDAWTRAGGSHRQLHFHWSDGGVGEDGLRKPHPAGFDALYQQALDVDYAVMSARQQAAAKQLRSGEIRVTAPGGTDLRFRVGERPFNFQNGDASAERMESARVKVDREIELPAGVARVAPLEETVNGTLAVAGFRFQIRRGRVVNPAAGLPGRFRELGIGFHPGLRPVPGEDVIPYFGYGAGVVRLSLGDNSELGGTVQGGGTRWFFLRDATVIAAGRTVVERGRLVE